MRSIKLPSGNSLPVLGLGTWRMGEHADHQQREVAAIHAALELGISLLDTAEMYGEGGAEQVIAEAIRGRRDQVQLVSKFYPHNASHKAVIDACERSLVRLGTDYLDLYLLHWPGSVPLSETFAALHELKDGGKIRDFGVSNFDIEDLQQIPEADQQQLGCNQVFYNLAHRETEHAVSAWCRQRRVPLMAYSPLDQASSMLKSEPLRAIAAERDASAAQIALAWLLHRPDTIVIPKSVRVERIGENFGALEIQLNEAELAQLDEAFPAPQQAVRLGMR